MSSEDLREIELLISSYQERRQELSSLPERDRDAANKRYRSFIKLLRSLPPQEQRELLRAALDPHIKELVPSGASEGLLSGLASILLSQIDRDDYLDLEGILDLADTQLIYLKMRLASKSEKEEFNKDLYTGIMSLGLGSLFLGNDLLSLFSPLHPIAWLSGGASIVSAVPLFLLQSIPSLLTIRKKQQQKLQIASPPPGERRAEQRELAFENLPANHVIIRDVSRSGMGLISEQQPPQVGNLFEVNHRGGLFQGEVRWSQKLQGETYRFGVWKI
jgi:hypothetical protein